MECTINGIPAWEHPKQMGCGAAADVISISTGSSSVSRGIVDDGTPPSSPQQRPSFLNLLPTRNSNANSKRHVTASSPNSNTVKGKVSAPTSPIRLPFHPSQQVAPTSPIRPPVQQPPSQRLISHAVGQQLHRTPNKSMDHRRMLNMDGYTSPNKMMISFDSDAQSCCPSVGDITWDHTEAMAFHNAATTKNSSAQSHRQQQQQQQQAHPWENFKEMKADDTPTSTNRESNNNRSPIPPKNKNRVFISAVAQQQQLRSKAPPNKPQPQPQPQQRRNSVHNVVTSTCPSIPDSTLLPTRPNNKSNEKSLSPVPRTNRRGSTGRPTPFTYLPPTNDSSSLKPMSTIKPICSSIPNAPTIHTKENFRTEINVNFSDCFSQKEDVPSIIDAEYLSQRTKVDGRSNKASSSSVDSSTKSTTLPRKEIDVIHPITIVLPVREKRTEHLRTALPIPATTSRDDPLSGKTITTLKSPANSRSNSYGSNIVELHLETRDSSNSFTEKGHNSNQSSINTIPMSNLTFAEALDHGDDQSDSLSKHSATSMERYQRQNYSHYQTTPNSKTNGNSRLNFDDARKQSSRVDDGSFQKWNVSKSSVSTSKSSKSATSQRSWPYNTVQQLEESIQNLEATLQMQTSDNSTERRGKDNDDRLVNLALESSFNDIYLRPSTTEKRMMPHQHRQSSQESLSATSVSMFSSSMMSSSLLSNMSMNSNNSMLLRRQPVPPNMLIQINTVPATTNSNYPNTSKRDDYADIETALAISSAIMDD